MDEIAARLPDGLESGTGEGGGAFSGGERQRVQRARALAQRPKYVVPDVRTNHLDIRHQLEFLSLVRRSGATALISLHDLNLAASYCDRVAVLHQGESLTWDRHGSQ